MVSRLPSLRTATLLPCSLHCASTTDYWPGPFTGTRRNLLHRPDDGNDGNDGIFANDGNDGNDGNCAHRASNAGLANDTRYGHDGDLMNDRGPLAVRRFSSITLSTPTCKNPLTVLKCGCLSSDIDVLETWAAPTFLRISGQLRPTAWPSSRQVASAPGRCV
jgi:hypothetical protein